MSTRKLSTKQAAIESDDLIAEILLRLPSCSISRFKSNCKQWHSLVTTSEFRKLWRSRSISTETGFILQCTSAKICLRNLYFSSKNHKTIRLQDDIRVVQSCNGLLLCRTDNIYSIYNPVTNMISNLPKLPNGEKYHSTTLAFDPYISPYYQVIYCSYFYGPCDNIWVQIHMYSSAATRCWTLIFKQLVGTYFGNGVYWNGSIHWIYALLYFNIENQTLKAMPTLPACRNRHVYFGEHCGRLNYSTVSISTPCVIHVHELKRDYSEWVLKYNVNTEKSWYYFTSSTTVLSIVHGEEEDDSFLVLMIERDIVRYNLVSMTFEKLHGLTLDSYYNVCAFSYIE